MSFKNEIEIKVETVIFTFFFKNAINRLLYLLRKIKLIQKLRQNNEVNSDQND